METHQSLLCSDPRRTFILLIGGDKTGNDRFYKEHVPTADVLYDEHLEKLRKEDLIKRVDAIRSTS